MKHDRSQPAIDFRNVSKRFGTTVAVNGISLRVQAGDFCVLVGSSGCGKSTTLRMVNRLIEPTQGEIRLNGRPISSLKPEPLRRKIGYVIQNIGLFPHWTVAANISVVPNLLHWPSEKAAKRVDELLDLFKLDPAEFRHKYPDELSGGQAQRVGVARALAADPDILLMDEPFGALDPITRETLQDELATLHKTLKKTIVFVTHDVDEAMRLATHIAVMKEGKIVQFDTPENILRRPANQFVSDFLGADRGLRRLSQMTAEDSIRPARAFKKTDRIQDIGETGDDQRLVWITGADGQLLGRCENLRGKSGTLGEHMIPLDSDSTLSKNQTLREALNQMLSHNLEVLPVLDEREKVVGELWFQDIIRPPERSHQSE